MTKRKILLLQPRCGKYDLYICDLPLSLIYLASVLEEQGLYQTIIIDQRTDDDWRQRLKEQLAGDVLMIGVTVMTGEPIRHAMEMCRFVRRHSDRPIVWGGIHPTLTPEQVAGHWLVDYVIRGKAEYAITELAAHLEGGRDASTVAGLTYRDAEGNIVSNPQARAFNWDGIPRIPYELVDQSKYHRSGFDGCVISIMTSRNCPHRCAFCYNSSLKESSRWVAEPLERTKETLDMLARRYKPGHISFIDDNFFVDQKRARAILEFIRDCQWDLDIGFRGARVDDLLRCDDSMLELMVQARTRHINIGVESGSERILEILQKGITPDQAIELNQRLARHPSLIPLYNFFSGIPQETEEDIRMSTDLLLRLIRENPSCQISGFHQYTPYPGSALYEVAKQHGFPEPQTLDGWAEMQLENNARNCPWISPRRKRLLDMIYTMIYFVDRKYEVYFSGQSWLHRLLAPLVKLYRPLCRARLKHHITALPVEVWAKDVFYWLMEKRRRWGTMS